MEISQLYQLFLACSSVQTDTRKLKTGDMFFALKGPTFNGNQFAKAALDAGAAYAVIDEAAYQLDDRFLLVDDVLTALQQLANHHRRQFNIPFLAITGSNGKTTTKELITAVLRKKFITYSTLGNLNNHIGVPLTLLSIRKDAEIAVIEMGANHLHEIEDYCKIAAPTHGLITNCGKAHIEGFGSMEGVRKGKGELYDFLRENDGIIFRNSDLDYLKNMAHGTDRQITYGSADADYKGSPEMDGIFLTVNFQTENNPEKLKTHLVGAYNFANVMSAVAVGSFFGVSMENIVSALDEYQPDNSRSQWLKRGSNQVILDAYNANPSSMKVAIESFAASPMDHKCVWLGGMKEMGDTSIEEHRNLVRLLEQSEWEQVILVGEEFAPVRGHYIWFPDSYAAADYIRNNEPSNAAILIKGSRGSKMEILLEALPLATL